MIEEWAMSQSVQVPLEAGKGKILSLRASRRNTALLTPQFQEF